MDYNRQVVLFCENYNCIHCIPINDKLSHIDGDNISFGCNLKSIGINRDGICLDKMEPVEV